MARNRKMLPFNGEGSVQECVAKLLLAILETDEEEGYKIVKAVTLVML
jgi:predicted transcriptional regulator